CFLVLLVLSPRLTLFPYTTLFRSHHEDVLEDGGPSADAHLRTGRADVDRRERLGAEHGQRRALPAGGQPGGDGAGRDVREPGCGDRKSTRLNSSHQIISYAVFCLK